MSPHADPVATPLVVVASFLGPVGDTGIHTHVRMVLDACPRWGAEGCFASPWTVSRWARGAVRLGGRLLGRVSTELGRSWTRVGFQLILAGHLARLLRSASDRPVVLYAQEPSCTVAAAWARRARPGRTRIVTTAHFNESELDELVRRGRADPTGLQARLLRRNERTMVRSSDLVVFPSRASESAVRGRQRDAFRAPATVIPHAVDRLDPAADAPTADLITIGTLEPRKNQAFLLDVLAAARDRGRRWTLTIVGDGDDREQLERRARARGVDDAVRFAGRVEDAARWLPAHRAYVHAALTESFGIVLVEAMAHGLPVLAPARGAMGEVLNDGVEGHHWDLADPAGAAALLARVLDDPERYDRMRRAALDRHARDFSHERVLPRWRAAILGGSGE